MSDMAFRITRSDGTIERLRSALGGIATKILGPDALVDALPADIELQVGMAVDCYLARIAHLEKTIADADHSPQCRNTQHEPPWKCDCWKSRVT